MAAQTFYGATLTINGSAFSGKIVSASRSGIERKAIDVTHTGSPKASGSTTTGYKEYDPSTLVEPGTWEFDIIYEASVTPPILAAKQDWIIELSDGTTFTAACFLMSIGREFPLEDKITQKWTVQVCEEEVVGS